MDWDALGAIADFLSSLALVATLLYIAIQVRDAKKMNAMALREARTANIAARIVENPHLAHTLAKINASIGERPVIQAAKKAWGLDAAEAETWFRYMGTVWRSFEAQYAAAGELAYGVEAVLGPDADLYFRYARSLYDQAFVNALVKIRPGLLSEARSAASRNPGVDVS